MDWIGKNRASDSLANVYLQMGRHKVIAKALIR